MTSQVEGDNARPGTEAESEELLQLSSLLAEYSEKVRSICKTLDDERTRSRSFAMTSVMGAYAVVFAAWWARDDLGSIWWSGVVISAVTATLAMYTLANRAMMRRRESMEVELLAHSLVRLVRRASQIHEHSALSAHQRITLDLRLGEAEASLSFASRYLQTDVREDFLKSSGWQERRLREERRP